MGTPKRERQKANRLQRQIEEARAERVGTVKRTVLRWGIGAVAAVGAVVFIAWLGGAFDGDDGGDVATGDAISDLDAADELPTIDDTLPIESTTTLPTPPKPEVEIPAEIPTELVVTDLVEGEGPGAQAGDTVVVHYVGVRSEDGTEFDNSYDSGSPFPVVLGSGGVIQGWDEGLVGAQVGDRRQLDIPAELAYGDSPRGDVIQAGDALTFVVDVMAITPAADQ